jgi:GT2 family glycosyltransferase
MTQPDLDREERGPSDARSLTSPSVGPTVVVETALTSAHQLVISILTWRDQDATRACLESLRVLNDWPVPTLVVDNGSGTGEGALLAAEFGSPVEALELPDNGGVASGYNSGISWAAERGASHVLLLNNDATVQADFFAELGRAALRLQLLQHVQAGFVRAAVRRAPQAGDARRDGGKRVGSR